MVKRTLGLLIVVIAVIGQVVAALSTFAQDTVSQEDDPVRGNVFVMTNSANQVLGNQIVMYNRHKNGHLDVLGSNRAMTLLTSLGPSADCRGLTQVTKYQG
jgi:hypothetical protein